MEQSPSKQDLLDDLWRIIQLFNKRLKACFKHDVHLTLPMVACETLAETGTARPPVEQADLSGYALADTFAAIYDYAVLARRPLDLDWDSDFKPAIDFVFDMAGTAAHTLPAERLAWIRRLVQTAHARYLLDQHIVLQAPPSPAARLLTTADLALLARVDEDEVKRAADWGGPFKLAGLAERGAGVDSADAWAWLQDQDGYMPTTFSPVREGGCAPWQRLDSPQALAACLRRAREATGLDARDIVRALDLPMDMVIVLRQIEAGEPYYEPRLLRQLSDLYGLDPKAVVLAALTLHQARERTRFLRVLREPARPAVRVGAADSEALADVRRSWRKAAHSVATADAVHLPPQ
jgi:hypothetical protein